MGKPFGQRRRDVDRRDFLAAGFRGVAGFLGVAALGGCRGEATWSATLRPLGAPDENGLRLPRGFRSRVVARSGERPVAASAYRWHPAPDGGAVFPTGEGGWIYVSNSEVPLVGGVGALRFDADGTIVDAYPILAGTSVNCAGGRTPWGTWLSCEEHLQGQVWECDPTGERDAIARPALGVFTHEAVAVDPVHRHLYLTEDLPDGRLYRFTPREYPDLSAGLLEVAIVEGGGLRGRVSWAEVRNPLGGVLEPTRHQVPESTPFNGGEGIDYRDGKVCFSTKGDNRVWIYDTERAELDVLYDFATASNPILSGVDNLIITAAGDVLVAEDAGDMQLVAIAPSGEVMPVLQVVGHDLSEVTGPGFDPGGSRLYFSSQRGSAGEPSGGVTYEVTGPFTTT